MKKSRIIFSVFFAAFLLLTISFSANALNKNVIKLKGNINEQTIRKVKEAVSVIYQNNIRGIIASHQDDLLNSSYTEDEISGATFSKPIPVFSSATKYKKNDDFKTKLTLLSWCIIAYIDEVPISVFQTGTQSEQYEFRTVYNQNLATAFNNAIKQLRTDDIIFIPVGANFFLANDNDNDMVSFINTYKDGVVRPLISFDAFNEACNDIINYNADNPDQIGGGPLLTYLYGSNSAANVVSSTASMGSVLYMVLFCGGVLVLAVAVFFVVRKINIK